MVKLVRFKQAFELLVWNAYLFNCNFVVRIFDIISFLIAVKFHFWRTTSCLCKSSTKHQNGLERPRPHGVAQCGLCVCWPLVGESWFSFYFFFLFSLIICLIERSQLFRFFDNMAAEAVLMGVFYPQKLGLHQAGQSVVHL